MTHVPMWRFTNESRGAWPVDDNQPLQCNPHEPTHKSRSFGDHMTDSTLHSLHVNGHSPVDLVSRVTSAAQFTNGMSPIQESGIERVAQLTSPSSVNLTAEHLVEKFFHLFDDLFFERSLRYGVAVKIEHDSFSTNTCCKGLAHGGKLSVMISDSASVLKDGTLGRLLHDMIHAYLWRYGHRAFTQANLFEHAWGFSGHGTAWQDIAATLETFMKEHGLPVDLGRNEALTLELEKFSENMRSLGMNGLVAGSEGKTSIKNDGSSQELNRATSQERRSKPGRRRSKRLTKPRPVHIEKQLSLTLEPVSTQDLEVREFIKEMIEENIHSLKSSGQTADQEESSY
ncbi:hypothetical protein BDZ45DRAFT_742628 [Acephala macrosclerotiorum]|nr:hypothetical protein BDZ45DRAFT_742628 [Acephala macrosclerotiorum]